jgi:uncharacterized peroxidase-related enzyme
MSTIAPLANEQATPEAQATLTAVHAALGLTPNLFRVAANSTAALTGLVGLNGALGRGSLRAKVREALALDIAQINGCDYCLSAHSALGKAAGLNEADIAAARAGEAADPHTEAILRLAGEIVRQRGAIGPDALGRAKAAGVTDAEVVEIVAHVALNVFTNYLNIVAGTEIDFPVVRAAELATV